VTGKASLVRIENVSKSTQLAAYARLANTFWSRLVGLLGRGHLPFGEGLVLDPGSGIHTFFMRITIDVVFVDGEGKVLKTAENVRPFRVVMCARHTRHTLELPAGTVGQTKTEVGDQVEISPA
jgi:uncharacterized membrane protein (UPF0127 family)